jgi:hypothetical protein
MVLVDCVSFHFGCAPYDIVDGRLGLGGEHFLFFERDTSR